MIIDENVVKVDTSSLSHGTYEYLLAAIVESSEDVILSMDMNGIVTSWNNRAEKMFGYVTKEIIGKPISLIYPSNKASDLKEITTKIKENERIEHFETKRKHKDGNLIDVSLSISPIKNAKGDIIGIAKIIRDISGQKRASQYARSLIEASLDPLVTISPEGKITDVNEATVKVTGVTREKLIGTDFSNYFTEPDDAREGYERVFKEGFVTDYPLSIRHASGNITHVLYNASVYKDDKGSVLGVFAAARDATHTKQKDEFSAMIGHELKTPLVSILGYSEMLMEEGNIGELTKTQKDYVKIIFDNATRLLRLIQDIMDARKIELNKLNLDIYDSNTKEITHQCLNAFNTLAKSKGVTGVDILKKVKSDPNLSKTKIVFITASSPTDAVITDLQKQGALEVVQKPINKKTLLNLVVKYA